MKTQLLVENVFGEDTHTQDSLQKRKLRL